MFALLQSLSAGNAVRLFVAPPRGAASWRILRKSSDTITGPDDGSAVVVADACRDEAVLDTTALVNGIPYHYAVFYRVGGAWVPGGKGVATPAATFAGDAIDPQTLVRDRIRLGLEALVKRGTLPVVDEHGRPGKIPVILAPHALVEGVTLPCVSVHMDSVSVADRFVGEILDAPEHLEAGGWQEGEGWHSRVALNIVATSLNMEERARLRQAVEHIILANLPVFDDAGLLQLEIHQRDTEGEGPNNAFLYYSLTQLSCVAPSFVTSVVPEIADVFVSASTPDPMGTADDR